MTPHLDILSKALVLCNILIPFEVNSRNILLSEGKHVRFTSSNGTFPPLCTAALLVSHSVCLCWRQICSLTQAQRASLKCLQCNNKVTRLFFSLRSKFDDRLFSISASIAVIFSLVMLVVSLCDGSVVILAAVV